MRLSTRQHWVSNALLALGPESPNHSRHEYPSELRHFKLLVHIHYWPGIRSYKFIRMLTHAQTRRGCSFAAGAVLMLKILVRCRSRHRRFQIITVPISTARKIFPFSVDLTTSPNIIPTLRRLTWRRSDYMVLSLIAVTVRNCVTVVVSSLHSPVHMRFTH